MSRSDRYSLRAVGEYIKQTVVERGIRGPWRGNSATLLRVAPYAAINFASHEQWKRVLYPADYDADDDHSRPDKQLTQFFAACSMISDPHL